MRGDDHPFLLRLGLASVVLLATLTFAAGANAANAATDTVVAATADVVPIDPNTLGRSSGDAVSIVRWISPGVFELDVQNTSGIGYINLFTWNPPPALTILAVTKTVGGKCALVAGYIQCSGKIAPPKCTCQAGGDLTVTFTAKGLEPTFANGYWTHYGISGAALQIRQMTPVPYHIPSALPQFADLPVCKKGQKSTKASPCV